MLNSHSFHTLPHIQEFLNVNDSGWGCGLSELWVQSLVPQRREEEEKAFKTKSIT
jgi:hypothetical protein